MYKKIRAKFECFKINEAFEGDEKVHEEVQMRAVTEGSEENKSFSKWTPAGGFDLFITNPDAFGFYKEGEEYYLDSTPSTGEVSAPQINNPKIENNFTYHSPKDGQQEKYQELRDRAKVLAYLIENTVPDSREKSLAITKLEESVMWANAGIARN